MKNLSDLFQSGIERTIYSYSDYMLLMELVVMEQRTTGPKQSEDLNHYTKLNLHRMQRLNKTVVLSESLKVAINQIQFPQTWYVLTEAWCGDAAQNIPVLAAIAKLNPLIDLQLILRDENPDVMDEYLTNGGRSIPKLIAVDGEFNEIFNWGPRPAGAQRMMELYKENPDKPFKEFAEDIHKWYSVDKTLSVQKELLGLLEGVSVEK
ncbi:thioredoxin family protein [Dyadobacter subterraneus]|uniref:Thioredoxin family protein n=1 Tax=Dyadobacter subterraneus TaxID=2773304 RepID=A0ABR9WKX5_9BACT|nr:thioredoxin family protein [Dyadobacter subterraneus]MBE9466147.1 thioredoxin family protein [Dyadobacter subterraneus]